MIQFLAVFLLYGSAFAKVDRLLSEAYFGEKNLDSYAERYRPLIFHDVNLGKMYFKDEIFWKDYLSTYGFSQERELGLFLKSELEAGLTCSNETLSEHFDEIRYSYRLITLSYLLEAQWHMKLYSEHFRLKDTCAFDVGAWPGSCRPTSAPMKKFISRLAKYVLKYEESLPPSYRKEDWWREYSSGVSTHYSQYKMKSLCQGKCSQEEMAKKFNAICSENQILLDKICSETDQLYGLSGFRDAYYLIGQSNIINTYNKKGEAMGCLRRFSEVLSHKEMKYGALEQLFPPLQSFLRQKYEERFLQGRVFFYGAGKEFEEKGLTDLYVKDQTLKVATVKEVPALPPVVKEAAAPVAVEKVHPVPKVAEAPVKKKEVIQVKVPAKSAFFEAAEARASQNLPKVEVDMPKFKYDYVFTLNMMNTLSERLKTFMTREALAEMVTYDKLGTLEGPVPLLFLKFMIDMQEHQGLWNIISVMGDKFYVSNEIDAAHKPAPEFIQLVNNDSTGRQWQIYILRP